MKGKNRLHWALVSYMFCKKMQEHPKEYLDYQRRIAEKILKEEFRNKFHVEFNRDKVIKGENGKPQWPEGENIYFNVTNTNGFVACAFSDIDIGVDAEKIRPIRMAAARRCCTSEEIEYILGVSDPSFSPVPEGDICQGMDVGRFFRLWTLKESFMKATGLGMKLAMDSFCIRLGEEICVEHELGDAEYHLEEWAEGEYRAAVCYLFP